MLWERDLMSWERDKYFFSHVPSVLPYGPVLGFKILNFNIYFFANLKIELVDDDCFICFVLFLFVCFFCFFLGGGGSSQNWTIFGGRFYTF